MGGYGSGRQYGRPVADSALRIYFSHLMRTGQARPGQKAKGHLFWTCNGKPSSNIGYECDMRDPDNGHLLLRYRQTRSGKTGAEIEQRITLTSTRPEFGGRRYWMLCPCTGARVDTLYLPQGGDRFASRKAWRLGYYCQRITARDRASEALFKLQKKLGSPQGWQQPLRRPKGMWWRTYERHLERYRQLDDLVTQEMAAAYAKLGGLFL